MLLNWYKPGRTMRGAAVSDTEALQTDVMRFMAIIGLCLTAIFSLMRSIADPAENTSATIEIQELQQQLSQVQTQLAQQHLSTRLLKEKLSSKQAQLENVTGQQRELRDMQASYSRVLSDKDHQRQQLESALEQSGAETRKLRRQLQMKSRQAATAELPPYHSASTIDPEPNDKPEPERPTPVTRVDTEPHKQNPQTSSDPESVKQGFVLKFASEETLSKLIRSSQVNLLAVAGHQAWQLRLHQQNPVFQKISMPARFYEMLPNTLPVQYRRAFFASSDRVNLTDLVWAVQIPPGVEQKIQKLLQTDRGGELIIQTDASVSLQAGGNG